MQAAVQRMTAKDHIAAFMMGDPSFNANEERLKNRNSKDPEQGPSPEPNDKFILIAAVIGIILGGIAGFLIGRFVFGQSAIFIGIFAGIFMGGLIGTYIGDLIKKRHEENSNKTNAGM